MKAVGRKIIPADTPVSTPMRLQRELTLSHLAVTTLSIAILMIGILVGYRVYLNSDFPAIFAADLALSYADDFLFDIDLNLSEPQAFVDFNMLPVSDEPNFDDWLILTDPNGVVIGTNYPQRFSLGQSLVTVPPPGFPPSSFGHPTETLSPDWNSGFEASYTNLDGRHIGLAPLKDSENNWVGWLYLHLAQEDLPYLQRQLLSDALLLGAGLVLIAVAVSGLMGYVLSNRIGSRLNRLGSASAAFAAGDLDQRVSITRHDEIGELALRYNEMADQISAQMQALHTLAEDNAKLAAEAEGLARLEERNHLARELHDAVKQQLFGLNLALGSLPPLLDSRPEMAKQRINQLIEQTQQIQVELDGIIKQLRPIELSESGLLETIKSLANRWQTQTGIDISIDVNHHRPLPLDIEQTLFRLVQESLQNCAKHAEADHAEIRLDYDQNWVMLSVQDNGIGFDPALQNGRGYGLENMRKRTEEHAGSFKINSRPDKGTTISAKIPVQS